MTLKKFIKKKKNENRPKKGKGGKRAGRPKRG